MIDYTRRLRKFKVDVYYIFEDLQEVLILCANFSICTLFSALLANMLLALILSTMVVVSAMPTPGKYTTLVQFIVTPEDISNAGKTAATVKSGLKNSIKQRMLDRIIPKEAQRLMPIYDTQGNIIGLGQDPLLVPQAVKIKVEQPGFLSTLLNENEKQPPEQIPAEPKDNTDSESDSEGDDEEPEIIPPSGPRTKVLNGNHKLSGYNAGENGVIGYK